MQSDQIQCSSVKPNGLQCINPAWAYVDGRAICRLHFNFWVGQTDKEEIKSADIQMLNDIDASDMQNIVKLHTKD